MNTQRRTVGKLTMPASRWALRLAVAMASAAALGPWGAGDAFGQFRIENSGRALDSNKRVGSEGRNDLSPSYRRDLRATPNQIVTGNVSGLYGFTGRLNYREASEFRGPISTGNSDLFIRRSSGGYEGTGGAVANFPTPFYTRSRSVAPPPTYMREGYGLGAYVPNPALPPDRSTSYLGRTLQPGYFDRTTTLSQPSNLVLQNPYGSESSIIASPLTGVQTFNPTQTTAAPSMRSPADIPGGLQLDEATIQKLRAEFRAGAQERQQAEGQPGGAGEPGGIQPIGQPIGSAIGGPLDASPDRGQQTRYRFAVAPEQQSAQYAQMKQRLEQFNSDKSVSDEQAYRAFIKTRDARNAQQPMAPKPGQPGMNQPGQPGITAPGSPGGPTTAPAAPGAMAPDNQSRAERLGLTDYAKRNREILQGQQAENQGAATRPASPARPAPLQVRSLATGVSAKGFADLLSKAEALMKEGKFTSALDQYDAAEQVAPNNPLVALGRANAELGAGYYSRADAHLRQAFANQQALLMAQYDLRAFLSEDRLRKLTADLKDIANRDQSEPRPVFLLAYIAYNTGNEAMAAGYLDLAEKRAGGNDEFYDLVRQHWNLSAGPGASSAEEAPPNK